MVAGKVSFTMLPSNHGLQFAGCLLVVLNHFLRKWLRVLVCLLRERKLTRLNFEHIADGDLVYEVLRRLS
jgi:hypothetical protein